MNCVNFTYNLDVVYQPQVDHRVCNRMRNEGVDVSEFINVQKTSIYLCWNFKGQYYKQNVGYKVLPAGWSFKEKLPSKKHPEYRGIRTLLISILSRIETGMLDMRIKEIPVAADSIRELVRNSINGPIEHVDEPTKIFWKVFDEFLDEKKQLSKPSTIVKYNSLKKTLHAFEKAMKYPMSFDTINARWYNQFMIYATSSSVAYMNNSIAKCVRMVKAIMNYGYELKYHKCLDYKRFKTEEETTDPVFLTQEEIAMIEGCDTGRDISLSYSKDIFLMGFFTGARISDLIAMRKRHLKVLKDGSMEWELFQMKGRKVRVVRVYVVEPARRILEKYLIAKAEDDYVLPRIHPVTINKKLKVLGMRAGLTTYVTKVNYSGSNRIEVTREKWKCLTVHVARKSFITALCAGNIPDHEIIAASGHSSIRVLRVYKGIDRARVVDGMKRIFEGRV